MFIHIYINIYIYIDIYIYTCMYMNLMKTENSLADAVGISALILSDIASCTGNDYVRIYIYTYVYINICIHI